MFCWIDLLKYGKCNTDLYSDVVFVLKIEKKSKQHPQDRKFFINYPL